MHSMICIILEWFCMCVHSMICVVLEWFFMHIHSMTCVILEGFCICVHFMINVVLEGFCVCVHSVTCVALSDSDIYQFCEHVCICYIVQSRTSVYQDIHRQTIARLADLCIGACFYNHFRGIFTTAVWLLFHDLCCICPQVFFVQYQPVDYYYLFCKLVEIKCFTWSVAIDNLDGSTYLMFCYEGNVPTINNKYSQTCE